MNEALIADFIEEEVYNAYKQMHLDKAPAPDGYSTLFYQMYWDEVGQSMSEACLEVLNMGASVEAINRTYVALIPKKKNFVKVVDFRLISLCNVINKIITKTMANRLKVVLNQIIFPF